MSKKPIIEVCSNSLFSSLEAEKGGAYRVELCSSIPEGGCTPSYGEIKLNRKQLNIKLNVIIRPRGGDFLYSDNELNIMEEDILLCRELGVDGVVFGILTPSGEVDMISNGRLVEAAGDMTKTFHRAFDMTSNQDKALEDIITLGFDTILSSGGAATAMEGATTLKRLIRLAANRITIMPGCGVTEENIAELQKITEARAFHMSARKSHESQMIYRNPNVSMGGTVKIEEYSVNYTARERVVAAIKKLK